MYKQVGKAREKSTGGTDTVIWCTSHLYKNHEKNQTLRCGSMSVSKNLIKESTFKKYEKHLDYTHQGWNIFSLYHIYSCRDNMILFILAKNSADYWLALKSIQASIMKQSSDPSAKWTNRASILKKHDSLWQFVKLICSPCYTATVNIYYSLKINNTTTPEKYMQWGFLNEKKIYTYILWLRRTDQQHADKNSSIHCRNYDQKENKQKRFRLKKILHH